jgi:hypothetical protein
MRRRDVEVAHWVVLLQAALWGGQCKRHSGGERRGGRGRVEMQRELSASVRLCCLSRPEMQWGPGPNENDGGEAGGRRRRAVRPLMGGHLGQGQPLLNDVEAAVTGRQQAARK